MNVSLILGFIDTLDQTRQINNRKILALPTSDMYADGVLGAVVYEEMGTSQV